MSDGWPALAAAVERDLAQPSRPWPKLARRLPRRYPAGVYVLVYHSVPDRRRHAPWEAGYSRVRTWLDDFERQLQALTHRLRPLSLAQAAERLAAGTIEDPVLVVTFDDGYANLADGAADVCARLGISPTVFVSADFASGRTVYHRVLVAELEGAGHGRRAAELLGEGFRPDDLLGQLRARYVAGETEETVAAAWRECLGETPWPRAHLGFEELRGLVARGWTVGNHTLSHARLGGLGDAELDRELADNAAELEREHLRPLPWIAVPGGGTGEVGPAVADWLERHPEVNSLFACGGVNLRATRTEWLRIPVSDQPPGRLARLVWRHVEATRRALRTGLTPP
jgi:peptidoglycan/xylan/chitin deacetylase (PgdA/CDA1 family)